MYASANLLSNLPIIPLLLNLKIEIKIPTNVPETTVNKANNIVPLKAWDNNQ